MKNELDVAHLRGLRTTARREFTPGHLRSSARTQGVVTAVDRDEFVELYRRRLAMGPPLPPDAAALRELHIAHLHHIPFETLSVHLDEPIVLDEDSLREKILVRGRGGFCYELNGLFAALLEALGYEVTMRGARVWGGSHFGPPLDHLVLLVECPGQEGRWLADVGFGDHSVYPLRYEIDLEQDDPGGQFRLTAADDGDVDLSKDGIVQCRIEAHSRSLTDFEGMCWYQQSSPQSYFTQTSLCTIATPTGRVTLSGDQLIVTEAGVKTETVLTDAAELLGAYRNLFGLDLPRAPRLPAPNEPEG